MFWLVGTALLVIYIVAYFRRISRYPPGPLPLPLLGNLLSLNVKHPHKAIDEIGKKYGPVFTLWLPLPTVIITGLDEMKEAMIIKGDNFSGRPSTPTDSFFMNAPNGGIIFSQGQEWKEQRSFALTVLRSFGVGSSVIEDMVHRSLDELFEHLYTLDLSSVDANWPVHLCVGNIVHQLLFGHIVKHADSGKMRYYQDLIEDAMKKVRSEPCVPLVQAYPWMCSLPYVGWRGYGEMRSVALELIHYVEDEIRKHEIEMNSSPDDTASTLVGAYLEEMKRSRAHGSNDSFHMDNLVNTATDIWLAGMETAATSIRWGLLLLTAHPEIQERLFEEIEKTIGKSGRRLTMNDKPTMPYASAFIYEVHRVANVVTFNVFRRNFEDDIIAGHNVPAGTTILPQISTVMSSEEYFDNADRFDPERFLNRTNRGLELRKDVIDNVVAFSLGKRQCAGEALARTEMFLVLLSIVQRFRLEPTEVVDIEPVFGILQTPAPSKWRLVTRN
ncbi:hypothetical protein PRIPAC_78548 [Pristionchus pacificus]|nr:hypothetical protein PRIPAC_78548 [Pristionchus pacificus]